MRDRWVLLMIVTAAACLSLACNTQDDDDTADDDTGPVGDDDDTGDDDSADDDDTGDDDTAFDTGPCAGDSWGLISEPELAIHVRADGSDQGDGSIHAPLASLQAALELAREREEDKRIAVGPGTYDVEQLDILADPPASDGTDSGLILEGCSAGEVTFRSPNYPDPPEVCDYVDNDQDGDVDEGCAPIVKVSQATGVRLAGFTTLGGRRALWIWGGADVQVEAVAVRESFRLGIIFDGSDTVVSAIDLEVHDTQVEIDPDGTEYGYGISVQGENGTTTASLVGGGVWNAHRVGILGQWATMSLDGVTVEGTSADASGHLGRGIQLQDFSVATVEDCTLTDNRDAGFYSMRSWEIHLSGVEVTGTLASSLPAGPETTGDGIVICQGESNLDPADYEAFLDGNTVTGSARAGILVERITAELNGNTVTGNGMEQNGSSIFVQDSSVMSGTDTWEQPLTPLDYYRDAIELDDLAN